MRNVASLNENVPHLIAKIANWHYEKDLIHGSTADAQFRKLVAEVGELAESLTAGASFSDRLDAVGDVMVVLINLAERQNITIDEALRHSYAEIRKRTGKNVDGVFVKDY